jgi:hypothetical protein
MSRNNIVSNDPDWNPGSAHETALGGHGAAFKNNHVIYRQIAGETERTTTSRPWLELQRV